jgi:hypothetical protein
VNGFLDIVSLRDSVGGDMASRHEIAVPLAQQSLDRAGLVMGGAKSGSTQRRCGPSCPNQRGCHLP